MKLRVERIIELDRKLIRKLLKKSLFNRSIFLKFPDPFQLDLSCSICLFHDLMHCETFIFFG